MLVGKMALGLRRSPRMPGMTARGREEERKRKEYLSNHVSVAIEKSMPSRKGMLMEQPQDAEGGSQSHVAMHSWSTSGFTGSLGNRHAVKEEAEEATAQLWETQWQEFLSIVEVSPSVPEVAQFPQEPAPWDDTPAFLASFEQVAKACQWPKEEWVARLLPTLKGEAELAFSSLEAGEREDYGKVKAAILRGDALNQEKNRQRFRCFCYQQADGPRGAYNQLQELCHRWLKVERSSKEQILELLILEQFLTVLPPEIQCWVKKHNLESSTQAVSLAEDFLLKQWVPEVKEEQIAESQGEGSMDSSEVEGTQSDDGQRPQLYRESETEEDTDFSDTDLLADGGEVCENEENHPQENLGHQRIHTGENSYICSDCGEAFLSRISLAAHQRMHMGQVLPPPEVTVYIGSECGETFSNTLDLDAHQRIHTEQKSYTCKECGEKFCHRLDLRKHQRIHNGERPFKFSGSGEGILWISSHKSHRKIRTGNNAALILHKRTQTMKKGFSCLKCGKVCTDAWKLRRHQNVHARECTDCGESFRWNSSLQRHKMSHERKKRQPLLKRIFSIQKGKHTCADCGKSFYQPSLLIKHQCSRSPKKSYKCMDCGESFLSSPSLDEHRKVHSENKLVPPLPNVCSIQKNSYKCSECGESFVSQITLTVHQCTHSGEKHYQCPDCGERFMSQQSLKEHRKITHKGKSLVPLLEKLPDIQGKPYTYKKYGKSFAGPSHLVTHQWSHVGKKPYACAECGESFILRSSLNRHRKHTKHEDKKPGPLLQKLSDTQIKPYACSECGKSFSQMNGLRSHWRIHTGEKPYQCTICGESFTWKPSLDWHMKKRHKGMRPLLKRRRGVQRKPPTCKTCGESFSCIASLMRHQRLHTGEKPYKFTVCGKSFMWKATLERHREEHKRKKTGSRLKGTSRSQGNICSERGKRFDTTSDLTRHQRIHTGVRSYQCTDCGESFTGNSSLRAHRKTHKAQKPSPFMQKLSSMKGNAYGCLECGKSFSSLFNLRRHQFIHTQKKSYKRAESFLGPASLSQHKMTIHRGKKSVHFFQRIPSSQGELVTCSKYKKSLHKQSEVLRGPPAQTESKNYPCSQCGKSFNWRSSLLRHQKIHLGVKPYKCSECGKRFLLKEYLGKHKKSHPGFR